MLVKSRCGRKVEERCEGGDQGALHTRLCGHFLHKHVPCASRMAVGPEGATQTDTR